MSNRPIPFLLLAAALPAFAALAQGAPIPLAPPSAPEPAGPIQVETLASLSPDEIGLLDERHGGLGMALWKDSGMGLIGKALPMLPNQPGWRSLRGLQIRLLESTANLPAGKAPGEPMIALRAGKLAGMGAADGVAALLRLLPSPAMTPILRRLQVDSALLGGDAPAACALEPALRAGQGSDNYALQLQVFCQFLAGHGNEAGLGIDLLRDQKLKDPLFFAAADALSGLPPARLDGLGEASPLDLAIAGLAKVTLPDSAVAAAPPATLAALARLPGLSPDGRLAAAERGVRLGTVPAELWRQLAEAFNFTAAELAAAGGDSGKTVKGRALLYKAASEQILPPGRTALIQRALAAEPALTPILFAPMLAALPASADLAGFAPWAIRALLAGGQSEAARPWFGVLRADGLLNAASATNAAALKPLARLAGLGEALTSADLTAWKQARNEPAADAAKRSLLLLSLLAALGDSPPEAEWLDLLDGPPIITGKMSRSALNVGLTSAVAGHRRGETVLYALLSLGEQRDVEPAQFAQIVAGLRAVGLDDDARAFALELALAYGL